FRTIQRAINETYKYNMNGYNQFINCADGTYPECPIGSATNGVGTVYIRGSSGNAQACTVGFGFFFNGGNWAIGNLRIVNPGGQGGSVDAIAINNAGCSLVVYGNIYLGSVSRSHFVSAWSSHLSLAAGSNITCEANIA